MHFVKIACLALVLICFAETSVSAVDVEVSVNANVNFSELNDYGEWVIVPGYGTVWRPDVDPGWRPFTYGHWVYSSDGWVWNSDEPIGWIVCHYGSWLNDRDHGWVWIPGYDWSPARVRWHVTDHEIGWAPLEPGPRRGYRGSSVHIQWSFAPVNFFIAGEVRNHLVFRDRPARVSVSAGPPRREFVQRYAGRPVVTVTTNKVGVSTRARPLVRLEVRNQNNESRNVVVPMGPQYKRSAVQSAPRPSRDNQDDQNRSRDDKAKKKKITIEMKD